MSVSKITGWAFANDVTSRSSKEGGSAWRCEYRQRDKRSMRGVVDLQCHGADERFGEIQSPGHARARTDRDRRRRWLRRAERRRRAQIDKRRRRARGRALRDIDARTDHTALSRQGLIHWRRILHLIGGPDREDRVSRRRCSDSEGCKREHEVFELLGREAREYIAR